MKFGVVVFPGSNCEQDCYHAIKVLGADVSYIWHRSEDIDGFDCVILPGGFSYGDYLRTGAIARFSRVMRAVKKFAAGGGLVLGICNGFQVLLEAGLLPGAMLPNTSLKFICRQVNLRVENDQTPFTSLTRKGQVLAMPIAHYEGNYFADEETLKSLEQNNQIVLKYSTPSGEITSAGNPNGSLKNIAGISNKDGNIFGLMPHPERAVESILGSTDGQIIFRSLMESLVKS